MQTESEPNDHAVAQRPYALGHTHAEHERLVVQARLIEPNTERLFRDAGVGAGDRVLDVGSGLGDVALIAARLVGPAGSVVGVDRDAAGLARARERVAAAGWRNTRFVEGDINVVRFDAPFDAIVGRFVLLFQPDPLAVMRRLAEWLRPGGVMVFQEPSWTIWRPLLAHLPLRSACVAIMHAALLAAGANPDMEFVLPRAFADLGLERSNLRLEMPCGTDAGTRGAVHDLFRTLAPRIAEARLSLAALEPLATLAERLDAELDAAATCATRIGLAGAWARKPGG
jgi:ubiquinone/menaquinone biosynthesis C-methylase UbiE